MDWRRARQVGWGKETRSRFDDTKEHRSGLRNEYRTLWAKFSLVGYLELAAKFEFPAHFLTEPQTAVKEKSTQNKKVCQRHSPAQSCALERHVMAWNATRHGPFSSKDVVVAL